MVAVAGKILSGVVVAKMIKSSSAALIPDISNALLAAMTAKSQVDSLVTSGHTHMLDLGANINSGPKSLVEFAIMGSIAVKYTENINSPTGGLLNVGEEEMKGNDNIKKTSELLKASNLNYIGFLE
jgi:fatty acid/phospholipid biosynthesis enzyme